MWDTLWLQAMGTVCGRALVAPRWTSKQEPVVGNWSRLSASAGDAGAPSRWSGRDSGCQGSLCREDKLSLNRELELGQVGWDSTPTPVSVSLPAFDTNPFPSGRTCVSPGPCELYSLVLCSYF